MRYINGTRLDDRIVRYNFFSEIFKEIPFIISVILYRVDWDAGFIEGRQYGRGKSGGQVRDEYRQDFDGGRGGYGHSQPKTDKSI